MKIRFIKGKKTVALLPLATNGIGLSYHDGVLWPVTSDDSSSFATLHYDGSICWVKCASESEAFRVNGDVCDEMADIPDNSVLEIKNVKCSNGGFIK